MSHELLLGKPVLYTSQYDPALLFPVPRSHNRENLSIKGAVLPFVGVDLWNAYEVSWLNSKGKPVVALAEFRFPFDSPCIVESKSFKLYLNSFNGTRFSSTETVLQTLKTDLSACSAAPVEVRLQDVQDHKSRLLPSETYILLDDEDIAVADYAVEPSILKYDALNNVSESFYSQLLKSNCPVTGQPDWATVFINYSGPAINRESLLRYLIGFRDHAEFHEHCVERIFCDLWQRCHCTSLSVYARYTRRGGLDINPFRSSEPNAVLNFFCARQ